MTATTTPISPIEAVLRERVSPDWEDSLYEDLVDPMTPWTPALDEDTDQPWAKWVDALKTRTHTAAKEAVQRTIIDTLIEELHQAPPDLIPADARGGDALYKLRRDLELAAASGQDA